MERHECIRAVGCTDADPGFFPTEARVVRRDHYVGGEQKRVCMRSDITFGGDDEPLGETPRREEVAGMHPILVLDRRRRLPTDGFGSHLLDIVT